MAEEVDVEEVGVDEIDHAAVEERGLVEQHAVEDAVNEVAERAAEDEGERGTEKKVLVPRLVQVEQDAGAGGDGKEGKEHLAADIDAEGHPGVLDIGQAQEIANDDAAAAV